MSRSQSFDPIPQITRYLHPSACGLPHGFDPADCLTAIAAAKELRDGLGSAGLVLLSSTVANFVTRRFEDLTSPEPAETGQSGPIGPTAVLYTEMVRIKSRRSDGTLARTAPLARPLAEIVLVDFGMSHDADVVGAIIEPEPTWIDGLLQDLGQNYAGWTS